jgi:deoxycytidine triphosphate deaminase
MVIPLGQWSTAKIGVSAPGRDPVEEALTTTDERIALDLHVGDHYEKDHRYIQFTDSFVLRPNTCVRIRTTECLETPPDVFGQVCSRASLTAEGLIVSNLKIDPNFAGPLELAVFNGGKRPIKIDRDKAFACIWFARLDSPLGDTKRRFATPTQGLASRSVRERARKFGGPAATVLVSLVTAELLRLIGLL